MAALDISYPTHIPPVPNNSQEFIDRLRAKVNWAQWHVDRITTRVTHLQAMIQDLQNQRSIISDYWEELKVTNDLAKQVEAILHSAKAQARRVSRNSQWTMKAIKSLVVDVRDTLNAAEEVRDLIRLLLSRIQAMNEPGLDPTKSIYKMLKDVETEVGTAILSIVTAVKATLDVLKGANKLDNALRDDQDGIQAQLQDMITHLRTGKRPGLEDPDLPEYGPIPTFPLEDSDDDYYDRLKAQADRIDGKTQRLERAIARLNERKTILESRRDVIKKGLDAALAARS